MDSISPVVLFADADLRPTRGVRKELRRRGARVVLAPSRPQALERTQETQPRVIVLGDALCPDDVEEFIDSLRSACGRSEIALLSSGPAPLGLGLLLAAPKPVASGTLLEVIASALPGLQSPPGPAPRSSTILCVDDDRTFLLSLARFLGRHGYDVKSIVDPHEAMRAIPGIGPRLAILDVRMPGVDGRELAQEIRKEYHTSIPIIMLSALGSEPEVTSGYLNGASYYLTKPCDPEKLLDVVDYYAGDLDPEERDILLFALSGNGGGEGA